VRLKRDACLASWIIIKQFELMSDNRESSMVKSTQPERGNQAADSFILEGEKLAMNDAVAEGKSNIGLGPLPVASDSTRTENKQSSKDTDNLKICNCPCHSNSSDCIFNEKLSESVRFRELLILHLDLIEEQNAVLQLKEKHIHNLKVENEQLNARLSRMERRVTVKTRKHTDEADADSGKNKPLINKRSYSLSGSETSNKPKRIPIRSASSLNVTSRQFKDHATGRFLSTDIDYLETTAYSIFKAKTESKEVSRIAVPTWKDVPVEHIPKGHRSRNVEKNCAEGLEEITDDESYQRRHSKMELDEIRRKRWDIQQMRQERIHENLRQKQREREDPSQVKQKKTSTNNNTESLHPSPGNAMFIEVATELPVYALGSRIPELEPSEFNLPWFDMAKREALSRQKKMKTIRGQRRKTWHRY